MVECRPGEGFPVHEIAARIVEAVSDAASLAFRIPALREAALEAAYRRALALNAVNALRGSYGRVDLTRTQVDLLLDADSLASGALTRERLAGVVPATAGTIVLGFALRGAARSVSRWTGVPRPVARVAVAAGGTIAVAALARRLASL